jgi:hypothetical protein
MSEKTAKNDITGDSIKTKSASKNYYDNYDLIFRKNKEENNDKNINSNTDTSTNK